MPPRRPAIPADIQRAVLVEAGHRCAIPTCRATTTEIAHIEAWAKSRDHSFANLIALCPTCHTRYDQKKEIDLASMRMYKAKLGEQSQIQAQLEKLTGGVEKMQEENQLLKQQLALLAAHLNIDPQAATARQALAAGNLQPTADYLQQAEQAAQAEIHKTAQENAAARQTAAENARQLAAISDTLTALAALQRATEYEPGNVLNWGLLGDMQMQAGDLAAAEKTFLVAFEITERADTQSDGHLRNLSISYNKIGTIRQAQGDLAAALAAFHKDLEIIEKLARQDPVNSQWQIDLSRSYSKIGEIQQAQYDLPGALASCRKSLEITEKLVQQAPANSEWQRDLTISYERIGEIQQTQGDLPSALASHCKGLDIREKLAQQDPDNSDWQRALSISYNQIGTIQLVEGNLDAALTSCRKDLQIMEKLVRQDSANSGWQHDLSVSYERIGDIHLAQGDLADALAFYSQSLDIREKLTHQDAANVQWQASVVASCWRMSFVSNGAERQGYLQRGLAILQRLQQENRLTAEQQGWIGLFQEALQ